MWWKDCRKYHSSTKKEIVQQAISWQAMLKLRNSMEEKLIYPKLLADKEHGGRLTAYDNLHLVDIELDQWPEIQLIMPGFYDLDS